MRVNFSFVKGILGAAVVGLAATDVRAADAVVVQSEANGYNSWPIVQAIGSKVVCAYSRGSAHDISQGARGVYARTSADGGATWGDEVTVANDASCGEVAIGKGLDAKGAMLLWVRCWGGANPHHDLYRTTDGVSFEKIATPALDPVPMQITDVFAVPGVGLTCLWFSDGYAASSVRAWGKLVSADNGLTWTRTTIETNLKTENWPTEPAGVWLGDGKILVIARCEGANRQFQIASTDSGATWTKRTTNITDVYKSTPSLVLDPATGLLSNYYYERGAKKLKRRVAVAADIFARPDEWPSPELLYTGEETVDIDAGNVNVTVLADGRHLAATYTGSSRNTKIVALVVSAPTSVEEKPTSADVDLPPARGGLPLARCYSQRGLVLHLDGRENAGAGLDFYADATEWKDLSPSGNDAKLTEGGYFENGVYGLQMKIVSGVYYAAVTKGNVTAGLTAECLVKPTGGDKGMLATVWGGAGSDGGVLPMPRARCSATLKAFCFDDNSKLKTDVVFGNVYQFSLRSTDGVAWTAYDDGVETTASYAQGAKIAQAPMALGGFTGFERRLTGTIYAVRAYDRALRPDEIKANAIMDHIRFEGADPLAADWPSGFRYDPATSEVQVRIQLSAGEGLLVSLNGGEPATTIDQWLVRGSTFEVAAVPGEGTFKDWFESTDDLTDAEVLSSTLTQFADAPRQLVARAVGEKIRSQTDYYSQRGLVLHLDGLENAGAGLPHDADARIWKDLSPSENDAALTDMGSFGDNGLLMRISGNTEYAAATVKDVPAGLTAECLFRPTGGDKGMLATVWGGAGSDGGVLPMPRVRVQISGTSLSTLQFEDVVWRRNLVAGNAYQFSVCSTNGETWTAYENGAATTACYAPKPANVKAAPLSFGGFTGYPRRLEGTIHAVRVYDRMLSPDEMKANALLDLVRYEGQDPEQVAWPEGFRYFGTDQSLRVRVKVVAQKGCLVSVNGGAPVRQFDDWLHRGRDFTVAVLSSSETSSGGGAGTVLEQKTMKVDVPCILSFPEEACNIPATAYSREGLVLHYDGFENAGAGLPHDADARIWKDLSPSENDAALTDMGSFGDNGLEMRISGSVEYAAATVKDVPVGLTAECLFRPTGGDNGMLATVWGGAGSDGGILPMPCVRVQISGTALATLQFDSVVWRQNLVAGNAYQFSICSANGETWTAYENGTATSVNVTPEAEYVQAAPLSLGGFTGYPRRLEGTIHALRVYNRTLTPDELRQHALLDKIRFGSRCGVGYHWDETNRKLQVELEFDCQKCGVVTVNGTKVGSSGVVRIDYGDDAVVSVREKSGRFISWSGDTDGFSAEDLISKEIHLHAVTDPRRLVAGFVPYPKGLMIFIQ